MNKEQRQPPTHLTLEAVIQIARETALKHNQHIPTVIAEGSASNLYTVEKISPNC